MARKYTPEEREYARLRRNYRARIRYRLKKHIDELDEYAIAEYKRTYNIPTAAQIKEQGRSLQQYSKRISPTFTTNDDIESFLLRLVHDTISRDEGRLTELYNQPSVQTLDYDYDDYVGNYGSQRISNFYDLFEFTEGFYVSRLTGEIFDTWQEAQESLKEMDIQNAIQEGDVILNRVMGIIADHLSDGSAKATNKAVSYQAAQTLYDALMKSATENKDALAYKIHDMDEEFIERIEKAMNYLDGSTQDTELAELTAMLSFTDSYADVLNAYINETRGTYYSGNTEEGFFDT